MSIQNQEALEHFINMLEANNLPVINLPSDAIPKLQQIENSFFSTEMSIAPLMNIDNLEQLQDIYDEIEEYNKLIDMDTANNSDVYLFACGIDGYGIQNWKFKYFLISKNLRIMVNLPYGNAFADPKEELENVDYAVKLIDFCKNNLLNDDNQTLTFMLSDVNFSYKITMLNDEREELRKGCEITELLDILVEQNHIEQTNNWVKV